jgi:hypothetical protein
MGAKPRACNYARYSTDKQRAEFIPSDSRKVCLPSCADRLKPITCERHGDQRAQKQQEQTID